MSLAIPTVAAGAAEWLKTDAGDFVVYSDAPPNTATSFAVRYGAYREAFKEMLLAPGSEMPPAVLIVFRSVKALDEHTPAYKSRDANLINYSIEVDGTAVDTFSSAGDSDSALTTTLEFDTIWMLPRAGCYVPLWMSQGAGKVLATTSKKGGKWIVGGSRESGFEYSWERLFQISAASKEYQPPNNADYHLQIWGLMHWVLLKDADTRARFLDLARRLRTEAPEEAVSGVMGTPLAGLKKEIVQHQRKWAPREVAFDEAAFRARLNVSPAPRVEMLVWTADLFASIGKPWRSDTNLDEALAIAPELALVQEAWGRRMIREDRHEDSVTSYRRAISAGSRNYMAYQLSGTEHLRDAERNSGAFRNRVGAGGKAATLALSELRQAVLLNPSSTYALESFGRALYLSPEVNAEDVSFLRDRAEPGEMGAAARIQLALVLTRSDPGEAVPILREIINNPDVSSRNRSEAQKIMNSLVERSR